MNEIKFLIDMCLFQVEPKDFPYSPAWLVATGSTLAAGIYITYPDSEQAAIAIALIAIVHVVAYGFAMWGALHIARKKERFVQAVSCIFGTSALLQMVTWPFVNWLTGIEETADAQLPLLAILALGIWTFAIAVFINRLTFETSTGQSILITMGVQILTASTVFILFGTLLI